MKKIVLLFILTSMLVFGQDAGNSGLSFLKNGFGARNIAMGDLGVVGVQDVSSIHYNPAQLSNLKNSQLMVSHQNVMTDASGEQIAAGSYLWGLPIVLAINTTRVSDIEVRRVPGEAVASFNANYFYGSLSTGFEIIDNLSFGVTAKYLYEGMFTFKANGMGFDFGLNYTMLDDNLEFGLATRNIGNMNELADEKSVLPTDYRFGAAYNFNIESIKSDVVAIGGVQKYDRQEDIHMHAGVEIVYDNFFALRGGYVSDFEAKGVSFGAGINYNSFNFDYAFLPRDYDLGDSHVISLYYNFQ